MTQMQNRNDLLDFQMALWKLIEMTLNSYLPTPSNRKKFKSLQYQCLAILKSLTGKQYNYQKDRCTAISYLYRKYRDICDSITKHKDKTNVIYFTGSIKYDEYDPITADFLKKFEEYIRRNISPFIIGAFLHGSLATNDYTGFSDVDAGLFVKDEVMHDPQLLKKLQKAIKGALRLILKYDNLQHHGLFIIPEAFLSYYPEEYLPVEVYKYSKSVGDSFQISVNPARNAKFARDKFKQFSMRMLDNKFLFSSNLYDVKHQLSSVSLLPTLYLQVKGHYVYKKFSFSMLKEKGYDEYEVLNTLTKIRHEWPRLSTKIYDIFLSINPNPWVVQRIFKMIDWRSEKKFISERNLHFLVAELIKSI